jgi:DNA ligase-1
MLRDMNSLYNGKRTYDLQKVKAFDDAEYEVVGIETGTKKMLNAQGLMEEQQCVKSLIIEHKGFKMNVGSGLSDEQRVL